MNWKRDLRAMIDRLAVPVSAAVVGGIAAGEWLLPHVPAEVLGLPSSHLAIQLAAALLSFLAARRLL